MNRRNGMVVALLLAAAALAWGIRYFSDEARIRRAWKALARAVAEEKLLAVGGHVSRRYGDPYGQSYESLLGMTADLFSTYEDLRLSHSVGPVSVSGTTAALDIEFRLYGSAMGKSGIILGERATPCKASILMRREHGDWLVERVESVEIPNAPPPGAPAKDGDKGKEPDR